MKTTVPAESAIRHPPSAIPLLVDFLQRSFQPQVRRVSVENLRLLTGGASRQTWSFDARTEQADGQTVTVPLILRCDPPEGPQAVMSRALEFHTIHAAYSEGVLVPKPYFLGDDSLGVPFFIMERIDGETIPRRLFRDKEYDHARQVMTKQLGARLARIHRVPIEKYPRWITRPES